MKKDKSILLIFASLIVSILIGVLLQNNSDAAEIVRPLGTIYINLIKMIMLPLVVTSLVLGISSISSVNKIGKMGLATMIIFMSTTAFAVIIGLILSNIFKPGNGIAVGNATYEAEEMPGLLDTFIGIFPDNISRAFLDADMLQIIFISVILGIGMVKIAPKGNVLRGLIEDIFEVTTVITKWIMNLTPIGILGLMIPTVAQNGIAVLLPLGKLIAVFYLAVIVHVGITYCTLIKTGTEFSVRQFFTSFFPAQVVGFVTCSSAATLPVSLESLQNKLKVSREVSGFVLPLGATINMDGNALYQGIVALFVAQAYGIELSITTQCMVILTGTLASVGAAGVPGAGMIVLSTVLVSAGLPVDGIALVAGIDRILDMGRTMVNITGDAVTACMVEKIMKTSK